MIYKIKFKASALKEWNALDRTIQQQFAKKLEKFEDICKACALEYLADRKKEEKCLGTGYGWPIGRQ